MTGFFKYANFMLYWPKPSNLKGSNIPYRFFHCKSKQNGFYRFKVFPERCLSFKTQFKIELLLLTTSSKKVLEIIPAVRKIVLCDLSFAYFFTFACAAVPRLKVLLAQL